MEFEQLYNLLAGNLLALVFAILWRLERADRQTSEKRERAVMRECANLPDDDALNGHG